MSAKVGILKPVQLLMTGMTLGPILWAVWWLAQPDVGHGH